jgi:hypothetical protein
MALDDGTALQALLLAALKVQFPADPALGPTDLDDGLTRLATAIAKTVVPYLKSNAVPSVTSVQAGTATVTGTLT